LPTSWWARRGNAANGALAAGNAGHCRAGTGHYRRQAAQRCLGQYYLDCLVKSIAQAAVDQITRSVVNWINSGFNGQPSFVQNFNQYFANVADQAAGEFIKGSALSFLCSPFASQIKIAIAQSYANRNTAPAAR
jgi:hypothetical protein